MNKLFIAALCCSTVLTVSSRLNAQTALAAWTFDNDPIAAPTNNPAPSTDNVIGPNGVSVNVFGMNIYPTTSVGTNSPDVLAGVSGDTGANLNADTTHVFRVRSAVKNANGWSSAAPLETQGVQFSTDTTGFSNIQVQFDWYSTTQGEANLEFDYTTDGSTWINAPLSLNGSDSGATIVNNTGGSLTNTVAGYYVNGGTAGQNWFTGLTATISDPNAQNDPNFAFRMVNATTGAADLSISGAALNNSSGNWRFDNVEVLGAQSVPEPGTFGALLFGAAFLMARAKWKRNGMLKA
jgi:hypothetical protein